MKYKTDKLVKYNLKTQSNTDKPFQIMLILVHQGERIRHYTGKRILQNNWNKEKQRAKAQYSNATTLNAFLDKLANFVEDEYNKMLVNNESITVQKLKDRINTYQNKSVSNGIFEHHEEFLEASKNIRTKGTIKNYTTAINRIKKFNDDTRFKFTYNAIDDKFIKTYTDYLLNQLGLNNNTVTKDIKYLKTFLKWATDKGYNKNTAFLKFSGKSNESNIIFLTWNELIHLYTFDLSNNERLRKVRDIFCFGCFTGLRFSDIMNLKHENIDDEFIKVTTIKTSSYVYIPLNQYSKSIYDRYKEKNGIVFETISNQKMNEYLKELGKLVELKSPVEMISYKGTKRIETIEPKYKVLTSHIARKTFITNALEKGMSTEVLMDITTHKDYRSLKRYFKIVNEHKKSEMNKIFG